MGMDITIALAYRAPHAHVSRFHRAVLGIESSQEAHTSDFTLLCI